MGAKPASSLAGCPKLPTFVPVAPSGTVVGLDEWAQRKGSVYGTIVVDLETQTVIDVMDEHTTEAVEKWLREHPEVHTICRDRNGRYAKAARKAAPAAKQVADRFHLVQNLRENIQRELALHQAYLRVQSPKRHRRGERGVVNGSNQSNDGRAASCHGAREKVAAGNAAR